MEEATLDDLLQWIMESDDIDEIHEMVADFRDENIIFPVFN